MLSHSLSTRHDCATTGESEAWDAGYKARGDVAEARREALEFASRHPGSPTEIVERAKAYEDFLLGKASGVDPFDAARQIAKDGF